MSYITLTLIWLTVSFVLANHTQFIPVNRMLYIAHAFIWLPISFVPPHRKQLIELNRMPFITHATKTWTVYDVFVIANVLYISDGFHTTPFAIIASHIVSQRVSDRSVALAASCSSDPEAPVEPTSEQDNWEDGQVNPDNPVGNEDSAISKPVRSRLFKLIGRMWLWGGVVASTKEIWWITYEYKSKMRNNATDVELEVIKKWSWTTYVHT